MKAPALTLTLINVWKLNQNKSDNAQNQMSIRTTSAESVVDCNVELVRLT